MTARAAFDKLLKESGLSARRFARIVLAARGERTIRRWEQDGPPPEVEDWCANDVVRLERRGNMLHLQLFAPTDARLDRKAAGSGDDSA